MMLGEVAPGGTGSGLYGMLVLAVITVFVAGLMVGRTPEYLGKKIGAREMKFASLYILATRRWSWSAPRPRWRCRRPRRPAQHRARTACPRCCTRSPRRATTTAARSPASAANTDLYNIALGLAMLLGRFVPIVLVLGLAGSLARQQPVPATPGTLPTTAALRRPAGRRRRHRRRPDLPARPGPRTARGGPVSTPDRPRVAAASPAPRAGRAGSQRSVRPEQLLAAAAGRAAQAGTAASCGEPGDVRRRGRLGRDDAAGHRRPSVFVWSIAVWLWLTVVFANLAEAVAEGRGKAQAATLRRARTGHDGPPAGSRRHREEQVPGPQLQVGDLVVVEAGQVIPGDGDVVEGVASVDESAITGESAPVIRESGGDRPRSPAAPRCSPTGSSCGSRRPGESFLDRMIALVEGASRQKTPNEIALNILLAALTMVFLLAVATLRRSPIYAGAAPAAPHAERISSSWWRCWSA